MTTALTLERSRASILELEQLIECAVQQFHDNSVLHVCDLTLYETDVTTADDDNKRYFYRVKVEVRL